MTTSSSPEPTPHRDNGPYQSSDQAMEQYEAVTYGVPGGSQTRMIMAMREALLIAGVKLPEYEISVVTTISARVQPDVAQVIAGWIMRAHLAGLERSNDAKVNK